MSRSKGSSKGCKAKRNKEFASARLQGYPHAGRYAKKRTHRKERRTNRIITGQYYEWME